MATTLRYYVDLALATCVSGRLRRGGRDAGAEVAKYYAKYANLPARHELWRGSINEVVKEKKRRKG